MLRGTSLLKREMGCVGGGTSSKHRRKEMGSGGYICRLLE